MTTARTPIPTPARTTIALGAAALLLSAATLAAALAPSLGDRGTIRAIVDLPPVHVAIRRADAPPAIAELPRVLVTGHRSAALATVDLPPVFIVGRRAPAPDAIMVARQ